MVNTINNAFSDFLKDIVNIDQKEYIEKALPSRDWLVEQILNFEKSIDYFPQFYIEKNIFFGSFHRKTKKRPLDDIDLIICLNGLGCTYSEFLNNFTIYVPQNNIALKKLCNDGTDELNSIKIVEKFKSGLSKIDQYKNAVIRRNGEAVTLNLLSYDWNFDIVPAFFANPEILGGSNFYLIPDGKGKWKKTNPKIDSTRTTTINQNHNGKILALIRLVKYWQKRPTMPTMNSFLLETMILDFYEKKEVKSNFYIDIEFIKTINYISLNINKKVSDPKNVEIDINDVLAIDRFKIKEKALTDISIGQQALNFENEGEVEKSINKWSYIFGQDFPKFG